MNEWLSRHHLVLRTPLRDLGQTMRLPRPDLMVAQRLLSPYRLNGEEHSFVDTRQVRSTLSHLLEEPLILVE